MYKLTKQEMVLVRESLGKITGRQLSLKLDVSYSTIKRLRRQFCEVSPDKVVPFGKLMDIKAECCSYCEEKDFCEDCRLSKFMTMIKQHINRAGVKIYDKETYNIPKVQR